MITDNDINTTPAPENDISAMVAASVIDTSKTIDRPPTILSIQEKRGMSTVYKRMLTQGNISCWKGKAKAKKTYVLKLIAAACLKPLDYTNKLFAEVPQDKNEVIWIDTEQGEWDSYNTIRQVQTLCGHTTRMRAFNLRPYEPKVRCDMIEYIIGLYGATCCLLILDGVADLVNGNNDESEAVRVTTLCMRWTKEYNLHLCSVIHENKNDGFATGHIGSYILKKAETVISVTKRLSDPRYSDITNDMGRGADFEPFGIYIDDDGMPELCDAITPKQKSSSTPFDKPNIKFDEPVAETFDGNIGETAPF